VLLSLQTRYLNLTALSALGVAGGPDAALDGATVQLWWGTVDPLRPTSAALHTLVSGSDGTNVAGSNDAAGNPYWFNGFPNFGFNADLIDGNPPVNYDPFKTTKGKAIAFTYTGAKGVATPIPFGDNPKPLIVKFTKPGTVRFYCDLHPGQAGVIHVLARSKTIPSAKADAKALKAQIDRDYKIAKGLLKEQPPANTIDVGKAGKDGVEYFSFFPGKTTVPVGTTIKFQITPLSYESHTATTGPGGPIDNPNSA
jgi:plastocyanin